MIKHLALSNWLEGLGTWAGGVENGGVEWGEQGLLCQVLRDKKNKATLS